MEIIYPRTFSNTLASPAVCSKFYVWIFKINLLLKESGFLETVLSILWRFQRLQKHHAEQVRTSVARDRRKRNKLFNVKALLQQITFQIYILRNTICVQPASHRLYGQLPVVRKTSYKPAVPSPWIYHTEKCRPSWVSCQRQNNTTLAEGDIMLTRCGKETVICWWMAI